ncbi:MAG TPA: glycosyltransferase family 2 protein [Bryobacteraceae bacterium]|nr:glycosyltransferase family 2 protein [Bryobacteraceae bacterium]
MKDRVLALIVTYNSAEFIGAAVRSCLRQEIPVLVVDNGSQDGTTAAIPADPRVQVIANTHNLGFAGGVNQGVRVREAELYLLLNPDVELLDPIAPLVNAIQENGHSASTGLLVDSTGEPQKGFSFRRFPTASILAFEVLGLNRIWPSNPVNRRYRCLDLDMMEPREVEQPAGACLLFRRSDWALLDGFDERFHPVWFEDVDFCRRLKFTGAKIWFTPLVRVLHHGGHSVQKIELGCRQRFWYGSLLKYAAKHFPPLSRRLVAVTVAVAAVPRVLIPRASGPFQTRIQSIQQIWTMAWQCFQSGASAEDVPAPGA